MSHWWAGIPAAEAPAFCGEDTHTVRWGAGELIAVDHRDPEGDVTRAALAGESVPCVELLRTWSRRADDPHVFTLASRGLTDPLDIDIDGLRFDYRGPRRQTEEQIVRLLAVGGRLPDRLQATSAAIWTRSEGIGSVRWRPVLSRRLLAVVAVLAFFRSAASLWPRRLVRRPRSRFASPAYSVDIAA